MKTPGNLEVTSQTATKIHDGPWEVKVVARRNRAYFEGFASADLLDTALSEAYLDADACEKQYVEKYR